MKFIDNGSFYTVAWRYHEVSNFADRWPGFGPVRSMSFTFELLDGDLVGVIGDDGVDGGAVIAMAEESQLWAESKL